MTAQQAAELESLAAESARDEAAALEARAAAAAAAAELSELRERLAFATGAGGSDLAFDPLAVGADVHVAVSSADPRSLAAQLSAAAASAEATAALAERLQARLTALSAEALRLSGAAAQEAPPA